jgi:8-oxo-dGTP diphosphatase
MESKKRSVAGIAVEGDKLFIARRKAGGDLGGKWEFPGGKAEEGESDEAALSREFAEEFSLSVTIGSLMADTFFEHGGETFYLHAYRIAFSDGLEHIRLAEHSEWQWAPFSAIERLDFAGSDRRLLPALKAQLQRESGIHK